MVESIGALQAQYWPALPVALWSRVVDFAPHKLYDRLERRELVVGTLLRGTIHMVSAREHPSYARVVEEAAPDSWRRTKVEAGPELGGLRSRLLEFTQAVPRAPEEIAGCIEEWVGAHPEAIAREELEAQRALKWRPFYRWSAFVRAPVDGSWGTKTPDGRRAAPGSAAPPPEPEVALRAVVESHLRGFGPAAAEDIAGWIGSRTPPVRALLEAFTPRLARFEDEQGRALYDLPEAPRPDAETAAPVRLLPWFDSTLLAYVPKRRARILPDAQRDAVIARKNLQIRPTFLVDGLVAGTWTVERKRREATLTLKAGQTLSRPARACVSEEAERLLRAIHPEAAKHDVGWDR